MMSTALKDEKEGKELFRQAYAYSEKLQQSVKGITNPADIFSPNTAVIRSKIHDKCQSALLLSCSKRRKVEELLWRNVFYVVISVCKQHREILDPSHPIHRDYSKHLMESSVYYQQLMQTLQSHYNVQVTQMDSKQLEDLDSVTQNPDHIWVKEACQRCYIYLGDIARYQIDLGYNVEHSINYYKQAIGLDPTNGWPFNQLAALSESHHGNLEALYYYLRSLYSMKPFSGVDKNIGRLFEKNASALTGLEQKQEKISEPEIQSFNKKLFVAKFIRLQQLFYESYRSKDLKAASASSSEITSLCSSIIAVMEVCLEYDYQHHFKELMPKNKQDKHQGPPPELLLDYQLLLKTSALSFLPAYNLRLQGSVVASAFALSVLSLVINYAHKRLAVSVISNCEELNDNVDELLNNVIDSEQTMVQLLSGSGRGTTTPSSGHTPVKRSVVAQTGTEKTAQDLNCKGSRKSRSKSKKAIARIQATEKRKKALKVMNRRRRQHKKGTSSSDEDGDSEDDDRDMNYSSSEGEGSMPSSINQQLSLGEDIDLLMIESLSESSGEENKESNGISGTTGTSTGTSTDTDTGTGINSTSTSIQSTSTDICSTGTDTNSSGVSKTSPGTAPQSAGGKGRRNIVIAANFSMQVPPNNSINPKSNTSSQSSSSTQTQSSSSSLKEYQPSPVVASEVDSNLRLLKLSTKYQEIVSRACEIASKEKYLQCIKVFADWLVSYPAVLASCGKMSSATSIWSRLADLVNFLPSETDIKGSDISINLEKTGSCFTWTQTCAIFEDVALRGFNPLMRVHQTLLFQNEFPLELRQGIMRIQCLIKFAHYVVNSKTTPSFTYDKSGERFMALVQIEREKNRETKMASITNEEKAQKNRSKLMMAMAEQRLKTEVDALTMATAKKKASLFTPYLLPDAITLCNNLHLIKKLMKSKSFVIVIAKSVIESLDIMKKERSNYGARDAIKFLEKELEEGNRFLRAQRNTETVNPNRQKKTSKEEIDVWLFSRLVDCAVYFNCYSGGVASDTPPNEPLLTMLVDKPLVKALEITDVMVSSNPVDPEIVTLLNEAKQSGVEIQTVLSFHQRWQKQNQRITS